MHKYYKCCAMDSYIYCFFFFPMSVVLRYTEYTEIYTKNIYSLFKNIYIYMRNICIYNNCCFLIYIFSLISPVARLFDSVMPRALDNAKENINEEILKKMVDALLCFFFL